MMQRVLSGFARNDRGATAVEFAIILPLLLLFVFGIIEWGLYMYNRQVITNAAREGARYGVLMRMAPREVDYADEDPAIKAKVLEFAGTYLVTFGPDVLIADNINVFRGEPPYDPYTPPAKPFAFGTKLTVAFDYEYNFLFLSTFGIGPLEITGASTMRME
jgi:hypothetical protein